GLEIAQEQIERVDEKVLAAVPVPVHKTGDPLGKEFPKGQFRKRAEVDVRDMGKFEHGADITHEAANRYPFSRSGAQRAMMGSGLPEVGGFRSRAALWVLHRIFALTRGMTDRKSTRLNSSHVKISYAVFCLKKKNLNSRR